MLYCRMRPAAAVCAALLVSVLLSACGVEGGAASGETEDQTATTTTAAAQIEPVTIVIQMSGLLLLMPPQGGVGATHVLMPDVKKHLAYIGYRQQSSLGCDDHDPLNKICYINVKGWEVAPIGVTSTTASRIPTGALNLTRGTGNVKVDTTLETTKSAISSRLTFLSGSATDSCGLATWTFDPYDTPPPEKVRLINVLEWQIPNLQSETLQLVLRWRGTGSKPDTTITLSANDSREIELLVLHVTEEEGLPHTKRKRHVAGGPDTPPAMPDGGAEMSRESSASLTTGPRSQAVSDHFNAFYKVMGVDPIRRRMPTRPARDKEGCPLTILDLEEFHRTQELLGVATYSCVMATAEGA
jgi:hypothetical protein